MPTLNISVPPKLKAAIDEHVAAGEYAKPDDYVCDLVRKDQERRKHRSLEKFLVSRLDREGAVEMDDADFRRIRRQFQKRVKRSSTAKRRA